MKDASTSPPVCYTYYGDEIATMMTVTNDMLQIYRGTSLVVRAKAERMARELGNAAIVELVPDRILSLTPVPWYSLVAVRRSRAPHPGRHVRAGGSGTCRRVVFRLAVGQSVVLTARHDLSEALSRTQDKTMQLMTTVEQLRASPMREQVAKFADLNDGLLDINGFCKSIEIRGGKLRWRAIVPPNVTADRINALEGKTIETKPTGAIIGNAAEVEYEAGGGLPPQ